MSKNVSFDELDYIVDKCNNTYHKAIKTKSNDVKSGSYSECNIDFNNKDRKCWVEDHVRVPKYKKVLPKRFDPYWSEEIFVIKKLLIQYWT